VDRKVHNASPTTEEYSIYAEDGHILATMDQSTSIINEFIWMDDLPVGVLSGANETLAYIEPDHLGTPRVVVDPTRNVAIWKWPLSNDPFGESAPQQDPDGDGTQFTLNMRLPGQMWDAESGLSYNYFRDYDSGTGRYVESDPIGLKGGISTYTYSLDSPIVRKDAAGLNNSMIRNWGPCPLVSQMFTGFPMGILASTWICVYDCNTTCPGNPDNVHVEFQVNFWPHLWVGCAKKRYFWIYF